MDENTFKEYIEIRYKGQLKFYDEKAMYNKSRYNQWTMTVIVFAALTPVLAAIDSVSYPMWVSQTLKVLLVSISAVVAIGSTILKTFRYHEMWTKFRDTTERIRGEKFMFDAQLGVYSKKDVDLRSVFVDQVEGILSKEHSNWFAANQSMIAATAKVDEAAKEEKE